MGTKHYGDATRRQKSEVANDDLSKLGLVSTSESRSIRGVLIL